MIFKAPLIMVAYVRKHSQTIVLVNHQTELDVNESLHQASVKVIIFYMAHLESHQKEKKGGGCQPEKIESVTRY